jgi:hypothetical protein
MFRLRAEEKEEVVANCDHLSTIKFSAALPNAFTKHGAIIVIKTDTCILMQLMI